jgi:hypothetical protein
MLKRRAMSRAEERWIKINSVKLCITSVVESAENPDNPIKGR